MNRMVEIDALLPEVMTHAPSAPEPLALRYIREVAQDVCRRCRCWRETDTIIVVAPDAEGVLSIQDAQIYEIEQAALDGVPLEPKTVPWMDANDPTWQVAYGEVVEVAKYAVQSNPNTITIVPKATGTLAVRLILLPSRDAEYVPEFLVDQYADMIGKGAAGKLLMVRGTEYFSPELGTALINEYRSMLDTRAYEAQKTQLGSRIRTRGQYM